MIDIAITFPTRGRPDNVRRLVASVRATASTNPEIIIYVDDDDTSYLGLDKELNIIIQNGPRKTLSSCYNDCVQKTSAEILMFAGDDLLFRTQNWDLEIINTFSKYPDKIVFVHGNDGHWEHRLGTHGFLHRKWVNAVGYFIPPFFGCDFSDVWITDVANALGRKVYLSNILIEHMHPAFGKADWDQTHKERLARNDGGVLYNQLSSRRQDDILKLKGELHA